MPYVRQKTWLPMAPRIRGLSLRESRYGMGDAPCPSTEQLQGIVDMNDPCQNPVAALPIGTSPLIASAINQGIVLGGPQVGSTFTSWLQQNQATVLWVGAGLFGIALLKGFSR